MLPVECLFLAALAVGCLHRTARLSVVWHHAGLLWAAAAAAAALLNLVFGLVSGALHPPAPAGAAGGGPGLPAGWEVWVVGLLWAAALVALGELVRVHDRKKVRRRLWSRRPPVEVPWLESETPTQKGLVRVADVVGVNPSH